MDRNLALEAVRVTEAAALAAVQYLGRGDEMAADKAAIKAMHTALNDLSIHGRVVIGEGHAETVPMLYADELVGAGEDSGHRVDIALDALEGTSITAKGGNNALSVIAFAAEGNFLRIPDVYMEKIAVGPGLPKDLVSLDEEPIINLREVARAKRVAVSDLTICILDRPRHAELIRKVRQSGACIYLIPDGDVSGIIATAMPDCSVDVYMGIGGAPEGVLAAAALRCSGGEMHGRLLLETEEDKKQARKLGIAVFDRIYHLEDFASGDVMFAATGVTQGTLLQGISRFPGGALTHSLVLRSATGTMRTIQSRHWFTRKPHLQALRG